jgi:hypothetical protein
LSLAPAEKLEVTKVDLKRTSPSPAESSDQKGETDYEPSGSGSDFEDTIMEEEKLEADGPLGDSAAELKELESDNMLSIEQLRAKYNKPNGKRSYDSILILGDLVAF